MPLPLPTFHQAPFESSARRSNFTRPSGRYHDSLDRYVPPDRSNNAAADATAFTTVPRIAPYT
jgi:hypothetical protein